MDLNVNYPPLALQVFQFKIQVRKLKFLCLHCQQLVELCCILWSKLYIQRKVAAGENKAILNLEHSNFPHQHSRWRRVWNIEGEYFSINLKRSVLNNFILFSLASRLTWRASSPWTPTWPPRRRSSWALWPLRPPHPVPPRSTRYQRYVDGSSGLSDKCALHYP